VKRLAKRLGVPIARFAGAATSPRADCRKPRAARATPLAEAASRAGYAHILTGHTLDDQAETVLFRLAV